jgi:hypothetical protein
LKIPKGTDDWETGIVMRIILKRFYKKVCDGVDWFSCFGIVSNDMSMDCMFRKRKEIISSLADKLLTSQKGLSSMQMVKTSPSIIDFKRSYLFYSIFVTVTIHQNVLYSPHLIPSI